ncbi:MULTISPECIES: hypothetical protein [unclassified Mesorhizobium]|uniref:hypothetical protein n=1 Tax=unclassified Mesorhizobium TaxID=325217 RepID=UPI0006F4775C|nr:MULTISPECIES: hypothetical protein [unclassified Mesorhizobium]KQZ14711.1 hypothetical protein ASD27_12020 [Mesorhizobium sp. Root1471]KQZ37218.1 hypothetical protein ASD44_12010 [Mesorhizobium sp. Root554]MDR7034281.1 hypothetical protein [Mesorhizobium sp. BE184]
MIATTTMLSNLRPVRREAAVHLFAIGQVVRLRGGLGMPSAGADIFHITGTLPPRGGSLQYRIRSDEERHERVTTQDNLELVAMPLAGEDSTLIERTFGNGQGTETQQSGNSQAEAGKSAAES